MQRIPRLTVGQLNRLLCNGAVTSEQLSSYCYTLALAGEEIWNLHAFERLVPKDSLLESARLSDERRSRGVPKSVIDGIPISLKANIAVASLPLTAGSKILGADSSDPANKVGYNADVSKCLLDDCGAVLIGSTAQDEFGMGSLGTNVVSSPSKNPLWLLEQLGGTASLSDEDVVRCIQLPSDAILESHAMALEANTPHMSAGGSSCGSAISVAHGSSIVSLGSDTGGSVRLPAAWCGVTGLKPSYGLISRDGLVSYASSLDTIGIIAPSAKCVGVVMEKLAKQESKRDSTRTIPPGPVFEESSASLKGMKIGVPLAFSVLEANDKVRDAWLKTAQALESKGATVEIVAEDMLSSHVLQRSLAAYYIIAVAEASSNLARYDGFRYGESATQLELKTESTMTLLEQQYAATRTHGFGKEVVRRILCGTSVLSSDRFHTFYESAAKLRAVLTRQLHDTLEEFDMLLVPTAISEPPNIGSEIDPTEMLANDVMTVPFSMAGLPAISFPRGSWSSSSPCIVGLQLVSARHSEAKLLSAAMTLEANDS